VKWARPAVDPYRISNGSACTSSSYTPSHVIKAIRLSWCHLTPAGEVKVRRRGF
jgi:hypothetical protein